MHYRKTSLHSIARKIHHMCTCAHTCEHRLRNFLNTNDKLNHFFFHSIKSCDKDVCKCLCACVFDISNCNPIVCAGNVKFIKFSIFIVGFFFGYFLEI